MNKMTSRAQHCAALAGLGADRDRVPGAGHGPRPAAVAGYGQWLPGILQIRLLSEGHPYLLEPFMNNQVSWDSEPYIGISIGGYDDPCISVAYPIRIRTRRRLCAARTQPKRGSEKPIILSYAFFRFIPF
jgi:hypothetical protein